MRARRQMRLADCRGFTLLEVLVATLIAAVVLTAMNAAFFAALHLRTVTNNVVENAIPQNHAAALLKADLRGTIITGGTMATSIESPGTELGNNQPTQLDIFTTTGVLSDDTPWGDLQKVSYLLKDPTTFNPSGGKDLIRAVTRNLLTSTQPDVTEQPLLSGVRSADFQFYDGANWQTSWDSTSTAVPTPMAIKVDIAFVDPKHGEQARLPIEILVPIDGQVTTNSAAGASLIGG